MSFGVSITFKLSHNRRRRAPVVVIPALSSTFLLLTLWNYTPNGMAITPGCSCHSVMRSTSSISNLSPTASAWQLAAAAAEGKDEGGMNGEHGAGIGCRDDEMIRPAPGCLRPFKFTFADCRRFIYLPHHSRRPTASRHDALPACRFSRHYVLHTSVRLAYSRSACLQALLVRGVGALQPE